MQSSSEQIERQGPPLRHMRRSPVANALQELAVFLYPLVLTIVLTPLILHFIGAAEYGIYALAMVFVSFVGLIDIGMGPAVVRFLSRSLATSNFDEARLVLGVGSILFFCVGVVGALLAVIGGQFLPDALSLPADLRGTATFVLSIAGIGFFFDALRAPVSSIPGALQRFDGITFANLISTTVAAAATVAVLAAGGGVRGLIVVAAAQSALMLVLVARSNRKLVPELTIRPAYDGSLMRQMVSFSAYSFVSNAAGAVLFQLDKFFLGAYANVSAVTYYVVPGNMAQRLHTGVSSLTAISLSVSSDLHARGETKALHAFYRRATRAIALVIVALVVPAFVFARQLLLEWVGSAFATTSFGTMRLLLVTYAGLALTALPYYIVLGIGRPKVMAVFNVAAAVVNVTLIAILIPRYGLIGAAVAYAVSSIAVLPLIAYVERRVLMLERSPWPAIVLRLTPVAAGQAAFCLLVRPYATGLGQVIGLTLLGVAVGFALAWMTGYLAPEDRARLARLLPRRSLRTPEEVAGSGGK